MIRRAALALLCAFALGCYHFAQLAHLVSARPDAGAPPIYVERCSSCHGDAGRGDGLAGRSLEPAPRDFADRVWQSTTPEDRIRFVIRCGGAVVGLSAAMAPHAELSREDLDALVAYIRQVGATAEISSAPADRRDRPR